MSVDTVPELGAFRAYLGARWTFLTDADRTWLPRLDLLETTDTVHHPYVPTTFPTFPDLTIRSAYLAAAPSDALASAEVTDQAGRPAGWFTAWSAGRKPVRDAVRMDGRLVRPDGEPAWASLLLPPPSVLPIFDDTAVSGALRAVLAGPPPDLVTTFVRDAVHFAGALTVRRTDAFLLRDDSFARRAPAAILHVGGGFAGGVPQPVGPVVQRYGGQPWPVSGF